MSINSQTFINRYDEKYIEKLTLLLSEESLIKNAETINSDDPYFTTYKKRVIIKFCGLSGLSLLGGSENDNQNNSTVITFLNFIRNHEGIIKRLNTNGIYVDIKFLFAYPYSDFMYDLIEAENTQNSGRSVECIHQNKMVPIFEIPPKMTYDTAKNSVTYKHLRTSLNKLQNAVIESKLFNGEKHPNKILVKFTPLNILLSFLKINREIFIDPYTYSKSEPRSHHLGLIAPILNILVDENEVFKGTQNKKNLTPNQEITLQYFSFISHFRHLWHHPLTLYSTDATAYIKGDHDTLSNIKTPNKISYRSKAQRIQKICPEKNDAEMDLWKQHCKNQFLKYCSKFQEKFDDDTDSENNINPIPIFIVGAWAKNNISIYMRGIKDLLKQHFNNKQHKGLKLECIVVDVDNGEKIQDTILKHLNTSQLGIIIQTADTPTGDNKPNIQFERGVLVGKLSGIKGKKGVLRERVFVFKDITSKEASDNYNTAYTPFSDINDFKIQFYEVVKWLWDITELNSSYAVEILREYQKKIKNAKNINPEYLGRFSERIKDCISHIEDWENSYRMRMKALRE